MRANILPFKINSTVNEQINEQINEINGSNNYENPTVFRDKNTTDNILVALTFSRKVSNMESNLIEREDGYYYLKKEEMVQVSNFVIDPLEEIEKGNSKFIRVKLRNKYREIYTEFETADFGKITQFQYLVNKNGLDFWFNGNLEVLTKIKMSLIQKKYSKIIGYNQIGFSYSQNDEIYFISKDKVLNSKGLIDSFRRYTGNFPIITSLTNVESIEMDELHFLLEYIFKFNSPRVTIPLIAFVMSCFLKEKLQTLEIPFNHLYITGEAGAGKTQTVNFIIKKIFGMTEDFNAAQITSAAINLNCSRSNFLPFIIDEYKPTAMSKSQLNLISGLLRNAYNGTPSVKSSIKGDLISQRPTAPIILIGEMPVKETANIERAMQVYFSKMASTREDSTKSFKAIKDNSHLLTRLGRSCVNKVLGDDYFDIKTLKLIWELKLNVDIPDRVKNTISNLMLGIELLYAISNDHNLNFENVTGYSIENIFDILIESVNENLLNSGENGNSIVEKTLIIIDELAESGIIKEGIHYEVENNSLLAIRLIDVYPEIKPYLNGQCVTNFELLERKEFEKQAKLMGLGTRNLQHRFSGKIGNQKVFKFKINSISHLNLDTLVG